MIIVFGGRKGGVGKTTTTINIASALGAMSPEKNILLFDADRQENAAEWTKRRNENELQPPIQCVQGYDNIVPTLIDLAKKGYTLVVDTAGKDAREFRYAAGAADIALIPFKCSKFDVDALLNTNDALMDIKIHNKYLKAYMFISMANPNPMMTEIEKTKERIADMKSKGELSEIELLDTVIRDRVSFRNSLYEGKNIFEEDDLKAQQEINYLLAEVIDKSGAKIATPELENV